MKIYKLLFLAILSCLAISCSQDTFEDKTIDNSDSRLAIDQFDNSYLGVYKGLFSTNDGLTRGSVVITLSPTNEAIAQIILSTGEMVELKSSKIKLTVDQRVDNLRFSSAGLSSTNVSLNFSVDGSGLNSAISNVIFDNKESDILIAKNLSRAPLSTITGTYARTGGTGGFPTSGRTWNVMSVGFDNQTYSTQIWYGGRLYNRMNSTTQSGCVETGDFVECDINGSATILGYAITWTGSHLFDRFDDNIGCSEVVGTWSSAFGSSVGTFQSDSDCDSIALLNDVCASATPVACGDSAAGSTDAATNSDTPNFCAENLFGGAASAAGPGVWYSITTPEDQIVTVDTEGSSFDTQLRVFSGTCGALVCVGNDDDEGTGLLSNLSFTATANVTYLVFLGGFDDATGDFELNVACADVPPPAVFSLTPGCGTTLVDHAEDSDYDDNRNDVYLIDAGAGNVVSLPFTTFELENTWDFLRIFDGANTSAPEITSVNGRVIANFGGNDIGYTGTGTGANSLEGQTVVSSGQFLTVTFRSDVSNGAAGFFAIVGCNPARQGVLTKIKTSTMFRPSMSIKIPKGSEVNRLEAVEVAKRNTYLSRKNK